MSGMLAFVASPTVHAVGSVTTGALVAVASTAHYGVTVESMGLVLLGAGIPSAVAIWLANRGQKAAADVALAYATEAANRVEIARNASRAAAQEAAAAVLDVAQTKAHEMLEAARLQAAQLIAAATPVAKAVIETAAVVAADKKVVG